MAEKRKMKDSTVKTKKTNDIEISEKKEEKPIQSFNDNNDNFVQDKKKDMCQVILIAPTYYIINKNGSNLVIKNDGSIKQRGDFILY